MPMLAKSGMSVKDHKIAEEVLTHWAKLLMTSWMGGKHELCRMMWTIMSKTIDILIPPEQWQAMKQQDIDARKRWSERLGS